MRDGRTYWERRANRRRFLGGAGVAGAGLASFALVGCGDDDDSSSNTPSGGSTTGAGQTPGASASAGAGTKATGGIARFSSSNNTWDTFDADRSRFGPFASLMGYTNHGIVQWESYAEGRIGPGFAESWENPDDNTFVFKLREGLTWHNKAPVNGRAATMADAAAFIERNKAGVLKDGSPDANFYRKSLFQGIEAAEVVDESTLRVRLAQPNPFLLNLFAGSYTKVQAPEAIEQFESEYTRFSADQIIGTGNYQLTDFSAEGQFSLRRAENPVGDAWADGIDYVPLFTDEAALQAAFEQKQIDAYAPRAVSVLNDIKQRFAGKVYDRAVFSANPLAGTYYGGAAPWNDPRLIGAIFRTIDRRALIQQLHQGRAVLAGSPPPTQAAFALPENELVTFPGYLENREEDMAEAKAMWEAAGGPDLGEIIVDIPDVLEGAYSGVSAIITNQLNGNLGNTFTPKIETYATISPKIVGQGYGNGKANIWYGWITEISDIEPSQLLFLSHNSASPQWQQFGVKIDQVDTLTSQLYSTFDIGERQELCKEIGRELLRNYGAGIPYLFVNINNTLYHNYYKAGEAVPFITTANFGRDVWLDQSDPSWQGRPS